MHSALLFGLQPSQQGYPQLACHPRTKEQGDSKEGSKGFESPRLPRRELRWYFDNLSYSHAVDTPCVDGVHSPVVTEAKYLFDLVDGVACLLLGNVDAIVEIDAVKAQAVSPLYTGMLYGDKAHLRGAGGEQKHERE